MCTYKYMYLYIYIYAYTTAALLQLKKFKFHPSIDYLFLKMGGVTVTSLVVYQHQILNNLQPKSEVSRSAKA